MVTVNQVMRGVSRAMREMERQNRRAARIREREAKAAARQAMIAARADAKQAQQQAAADEVAEYERMIADLVAGHRIEFRRMDWQTAAARTPPTDPPRRTTREDAARAALAEWRPGWLTRTLGIGDRRAELEHAVVEARAADEAEQAEILSAVERDRRAIVQARAVLALDPDAVTAVIHDHADLESPMVESLSVMVERGVIWVAVDAAEPEAMPDHSLTLLKSGKVSRRALTPARVLELHRDALCAWAVRVGAEVLRVVPADSVEVVMLNDRLDPASGHLLTEPVLHLRLAARALAVVNLARTEAFALMGNLDARFDWNRQRGFVPLDAGALGLPDDLLDGLR